MTKLRVLVVDDSPVCRDLLREIIEADGDIEVVGEAPDGEIAQKEVLELAPDLVTLDLHMPGIHGLEVIEWIMARSPRPVLIVSELVTGLKADVTFEALRRGALDVARKPGGGDRRAASALRDHIRSLARVPVVRHVAGARARAGAEPRDPIPPRETTCVIGIGASAGGPGVLAMLCPSFTRELPACVAIVQHLPVGFAGSFGEFVQSKTSMEVIVATEPVVVRSGRLVVAPDDAHLELAGDSFVPVRSERVHGHRPAVDALFHSLARERGRSAIGVVLSGMGSDGAAGLLAMRGRGAMTIAQDRESSPVFGMPRAAIENGAALHVLPASAIAAALRRRLSEAV
jgi:two-component system, chemotaxis family, protein-glutamate methylesterase/glutaminase